MAKAMKFLQGVKTSAKAQAKSKAAAKASSNAKPVKKDSKAPKNLSKKNLDKLGKLSLDQKLAAWRAQGLTADQLAEKQKELSKLDKSKIWGRHQTAMKHDANLKTDFEKAPSKSAKGLLSLAWSLDSDKDEWQLYKSLKKKVITKDIVEKTQEWLTWTQMSNLKGEKEAELMLSSGRIVWRACPKTAGLYEYMDTMHIVGKRSVEKKRLGPLTPPA